jgi:aspartate kinase
MAIVVQKYGGSSVADPGRIALVAEKVAEARRRGSDVVVVVSAMGKTTDNLLALAGEAARTGVTAPREAPRRELDMLLTTGERVSMALLSIALHSRGIDAISFTGSQSGILTNDRHFDARIIEVRPHRIEDELHRGRVVIVAGYQGMSYRREITTLGRGGSDTTAVALAAALGAESCEIYSDVDGVYSADPRVVPDAKHLPEIGYAQLQEMAEAGAKVLNAQAVEWARKQKVTIHARRTADPVGDHGAPARETVTAATSSRPVRAIVGLDRVCLVEFSTSRFAAMTRALEDSGLSVLDLEVRGDRAAFGVALLNAPDWSRCQAALLEAGGEGTLIHDERALVSVVGDGLTTGGAAMATFVGAVESFDRVVGSPLRLSALVPRAAIAEVQRRLHARFVVEHDAA